MVTTRSEAGDLVFRPASPAELPTLERLHEMWAREVFVDDPGTRETVDRLASELLRRPLNLIRPEVPDHRCIVAERRTGIVGLVTTIGVTQPVHPRGAVLANRTLATFLRATPRDSLHICSLIVLPEQRGRGIGRRLLAIAEIEARALGQRRLSATLVDTGGRSPGGLFLAAGFSERSRRCLGPFPGGHAICDVIVLEKDLRPRPEATG